MVSSDDGMRKNVGTLGFSIIGRTLVGEGTEPSTLASRVNWPRDLMEIYPLAGCASKTPLGRHIIQHGLPTAYLTRIDITLKWATPLPFPGTKIKAHEIGCENSNGLIDVQGENTEPTGIHYSDQKISDEDVSGSSTVIFGKGETSQTPYGPEGSEIHDGHIRGSSAR